MQRRKVEALVAKRPEGSAGKWAGVVHVARRLRRLREEAVARSTVGDSMERTKQRRAAMRMVVERYVKGHFLLVEVDIAELGSKVHRPQHRGWWEFRSGKPDAETRLLGFFARPSGFVATGFLPRPGIDFQARHRVCLARWNDLTTGRPFLDEPYPDWRG